MAFDLDNFQQVGPGSSAPRIWTYTTTDVTTDVDTTGYFNSMSDSITAGDLIYALTSTGTTTVHAHYVVLTNAAGVVDTNNATIIATTDTD